MAAVLLMSVFSKLPLGSITSYQAIVHPEAPSERVFGRDLLRVEIMNEARTEKLFTVYNTHMKSHFVPYYEDQVAEKIKADARRKRQSEMIAEIISKMERPNRY